MKHHEGFPYVVSTALYPEWPFAKLAHTSMALSEAVAVALLGMPPDSDAARVSESSGWTIPLDYSPVHVVMQELHLGPYKTLREITWHNIYERYGGWIVATLGLFALVLGVALYIIRLNGVLKTQRAEIEAFNHELERKVSERTLALEHANTHERYLKDILKTIIDVNEILITSYSTQSVVENAMKVLSHQSHYRHVWIGLLKNGVLEAIGHFDAPPVWFDEARYRLGETAHNVAVEGAKTALKERRSISVGLSGKEEGVHWMIALPLQMSNAQSPLGVMNVFSTNADPFESEEIEMLEKLAADIALTLHTITQRSMLEAMELEKISNYEETILAFVDLIEQRDSYTAGHTVRVAQYCRLIAQNMGIEDVLIEKLEKAAILHDIGKVVTPDAILLKPGALTPLEYELIKQHAAAGYRMLSQIDMYRDLAEIIRYHHARFDGRGYPETKPFDPEAIPMLSHIMSVADAFDAMTSNRIYKPRKTLEEALEELAAMRGTQFLPEVVDAALPVLQDVVIDETSQMPKSELEERRFAYFFSDALTDLYNENYLKTVLMGRLERQNILWCVDLKNVSAFNKTHGWEAGNLLLGNFARALRERFDSAMIFRYHGDKFILLFDEERQLDTQEIGRFPCIEKSGVAVQVYRVSVDEVL
ncbi:MAG: HD domain-containing protein [Campylobacterales bacterium]|nr:HD domain-containing protein [Campylobacterales bacterium]